MTGGHRAPPPLLIRPRFSRRLALLVGLTHLAALAAVLGLQWGPWSAPLIGLIGASGLYIAYVDVLRRAPWSIRSALWSADGTWRLSFVSGLERDARLAPATFVSVPLVVLSFRLGRLGRRSLPLFADALDAEQLRRVRQRLRIEGARLGNPPLPVTYQQGAAMLDKSPKASPGDGSGMPPAGPPALRRMTYSAHRSCRGR